MKSNHAAHRQATRSSVVAAAACCLFTSAVLSPGQKPPEKNEDLLRFLNGDSLHGKFLGMKGSSEIRWRHGDARNAMVLDAGKLRRLAFNGGRSTKALQSPSYVLLNDGDRIPGRITALDEANLTLETEFAGITTIGREYIRQIAPNPHGGAVHYIGPFSEKDWVVLEPEAEEDPEKDGEAGLNKKAPEKDSDVQQEPEEAPEPEGPWVFSGGAYYSNSQLPIAIDTHAPDKARMRFNLAWRNRLSAAIAFHATLEQPPKPEPEAEAEGENADPANPAPRRVVVPPNNGSSSGFALTYGHGYVLTIYSNYAQLHRCDFDKNGDPLMERLSPSSSNLRLEEAGESGFELRCDRLEGTITLFADGRFVSQWEDPQGYVGKGSHLAFACQSSTSRLRVSDVVVSSWNGMVDSARSMEVDDRDIVLLSNGTDRFSGQVASLQNGRLQVKGTYADLEIPLAEVEEIRFAREARAEEDPEGTRDAVRLLLQPFGRLTVVPIEATGEHMKARHPALGDLDLDLRYSGLMEFSFSDSVLDSWDDDF